MRGILVLALGAVLIWVGVRAGSTPEAAGAGDGARVVPETVEEDFSTALAPTPRDEPVPAALEEETPAEPPPAPPDEEPEVEPGLEPEADPEPDAEPEANPEPDAESEDRAAPPPPLDSAPDIAPDSAPDLAPDSAPDSAPDLAPSIALGSPAGDPIELAEALLGAWIDQDPSALEARLNDAVEPLAHGQRRLLTAFWQAVAGTPQAAADAAVELEGSSEVTSAEHMLLRAAAEPARARPVPAASSRRDPLALAMRMVLLEDRGEHAIRSADWALAARSYSDLIQLDLGAPWAPHREALVEWAGQLNTAQAQHRLHPDGEWPSLEIEVEHGEGLTVVRKRVLAENTGMRLCVGLIREVNGVGKKQYLHPGQVLRIPTDVPNVLVDIDARLLVYRHGTEAVGAWEVGIGKEGHPTPTGRFETGEKLEEPPWMPIGGAQLPFGHPENPLGTRWIAWFRDGVKTSYGFHGTWEPQGVGQRVSLGCIRMRNEDVEHLYELLPVGTQIVVQP